MQNIELPEMIGDPALGNLGLLSSFPDMGCLPGDKAGHTSMLSQLLLKHETIILSLQKNINACDEKSGKHGTTDFLTTIKHQHEAIVQILRSYMSKASKIFDNH